MNTPNHPVTSGGTWGAMSGENPLYPAKVEATHENLVKTLKAMGLKHQETHGRYGEPERSVLIYNPRLDQMQTLGKLFGQESVIHSSGGKHQLHYTNGPDEGKVRGTVPGAPPHEWFESPPTDYYTHLPGNGYFRVNFDFDQPPEGGSPIQPVQKSGKSIFARLRKALPKGANLDVNNPGDQTANTANRAGFPGSAQHMVMEDAGGGPQERGVQRTLTPQNSKILADASISTYGKIYRANADTSEQKGWNNPIPHVEEPAADNRINDEWEPTQYNQQRDQAFWAHPNFYEWHDGHTDHHNPRPWDKQNAMETARSLGLIKHGEPVGMAHPHMDGSKPPEAQPKNDQAAGVGVSTYAKFASPYGIVTPGKQSNLFHYDYNNKLPAVQDLVKKHGFNVYYAGGKYGKPDLANRNYNTNHLMIYDPTPASGGDFGNRDYTDAWRQIHELSHALTYPELNKTYGEGRRIGKLGHHRTLNEAMRAVHWEWLAAHKQRELSKQIGVHIPDDVFHKELNTVMHDAVHRAATGQFTEPSQEGYVPHGHKVPLTTALDMLRDHAKSLGLQGHHDLIKKNVAKALVKGWPKSDAENAANAGVHTVMEDSLLERGATRQEIPDKNPAWAPSHFMPGIGYGKKVPYGTCEGCGSKPSTGRGVFGKLCRECAGDNEAGINETQMAGLTQDSPVPVYAAPGTNEVVFNQIGQDLRSQYPNSNPTLGVAAPNKEAWARSPLFRRKK